MTVFETETMAELCVKQGLVSEALAIYRRLVADAADDATRARRAARLAALERIAGNAVRARGAQPSPPSDLAGTPTPTLTVDRRGDVLTFAWSVPPDTQAPALQLLLVRRGVDGVQAETRTLSLDASRGTRSVTAPGLHTVRAAIGWLDGDRFVPLARLAP